MGCDDNLFCNGADSCNLGLCNNHAGSPCPGPDGDGDCTESCNENADDCSYFDPNGSSCSDGSACTQVDTCQNGACAGGVPVICPAEDACHEASVCVPQSGQCPVVEKPNGTLCNDGDACTQSDYCGDGNCIGANPLQCEPLDGCHVAGVCEPSTGECSDPQVPDGTPCPGGSCQAGSCLGTGGAGGTSHGGGGAGGITSSGEAGQGAEGGAEGGQGGAAEEEPFQVDDSGCGCSTAGGESAGRWGWWLLAAALGRGRARRRRPG
jgi:MYXO-CTERM domain-containing protein